MYKRINIPIFMIVLLLAACGPAPDTVVFEIDGSPNPLYYGGSCPTPVLTLLVSGPGAGLSINSIIAAYQLFDSSGKKVDENTVRLNPVPDAEPFSYDADRMITVPDSGGSSSAPDSPIYDFGEGRVDFAATVYVKILSPSPGGPAETYYFTSTKSIPVLPCAMTADPGSSSDSVIVTPLAPDAPLLIPPVPEKTAESEDDSGYSQPPAPPSCSVEPNNPNCVNP